MSIFNNVPDSYKVKLNKFPLSREVLTTAQLGNIYPVFSEIFVPNSFVKISPAAVIKTVAMYAPIYTGMKADFHCFAVPLRLLWRHFPDWIYNPDDTEHLPPHIDHGSMKKIIEAFHDNGNFVHTVANDLGVPNVPLDNWDDTARENYTIYPFLAYHKIWNEYFRNENLQAETKLDDEREDYSINLTTGLTVDFFCKYYRRNYAKDYFTSALPTPQKGNQAFLSVLGSLQAPVVFTNETGTPAVAASKMVLGMESTIGEADVTPKYYSTTGSSNAAKTVDVATQLDLPRIYADLQEAAAGLSAADFRSLFAVQSYLEQLNAGGDRYIEGTLSFYNTRVRDARAQRPEFLGMYSTYINPKQVVASETTGEQHQGELGAYGQGGAVGKPFRYWSSEHYLIMVVMSVKPQSYYLQGLDKSFKLLDQFDYPLPMFQHLGEEAIPNRELFFTGDPTKDNDVFGYQSRFAFWRSSYNVITGDFTESLKDWHLGRIFNSLPELDENFIQVTGKTNDIISEDDQLDRIYFYSDKTSEPLRCSLFFKVSAKLPFRYHSKPMLIG